MQDKLDAIRERILAAKVANEVDAIDALIARCGVSEADRTEASENAESLVEEIRSSGRPNTLEALLAEFGLGSDGGLALLRLAEALIRVPDAATADALIADKIVPIDWMERSHSNAPLSVRTIARSLALTAFCIGGSDETGTGAAVRRALKRVSTPFARAAVRSATRRLAGRFVHGSTIEESIRKSRKEERAGLVCSYDMLGEAALTEGDAEKFFEDYKNAIAALKPRCTAADFRDNHGISIKLSALHPRYEQTQRKRVLVELAERTLVLARMAKEANMGMNVDAEEADRLELSLDVIERVLREPDLAGWDGFGIVVQAYGKAAPHVIDWLHELATGLDRKIMIRLVKGAYWDTEIKRAQVEGLEDFPVYTRKSATDVAYLCCVRKLLGMTDRIYPQFAGHNAHTVSTILKLAGDDKPFELQRIHGMGEALHDVIHGRERTRCRIYAPVGRHRELLPYLARRMLENGANTSFVNQIARTDLEAAEIAADPFDKWQRERESNFRPVSPPMELFGPQRRNSRGWDLHFPSHLREMNRLREPSRTEEWTAVPELVNGTATGQEAVVGNPGNPEDVVGKIRHVSAEDVEGAIASASSWAQADPAERARILERASDLYESRAGEFLALLAREAGKTLRDAVAELREAVDFLRFYAAEARGLGQRKPLGLVACISPWNFPLAIFTGQVAGALAAGNGVLAKPAAQTPLVAALAVELLYQAGVPRNVLQFVPGPGSTVGAAIVSDPRISGVAFTGSTETAFEINRGMAESTGPGSRLIAETGGLNAMIIDSTALPEQAVRDIVISSFQSAGQRCSALRMVYVQEDVADQFMTMLFGAMDELSIGDPWHDSTDVGPVIDKAAMQEISDHVAKAKADGRLMKACKAPDVGSFVGPSVIRVNGMEDLPGEVFGPVLHLATFAQKDLDRTIDAINDSGFGLTFGLHTRIDRRVEEIAERLEVGNMYVNRNQIGAVVGSQPFGGEGLSGTGPKAGGPHYLHAFTRTEPVLHGEPCGKEVAPDAVQKLLDKARSSKRKVRRTIHMPGPTGESNRLTEVPRGTVLCLGPTENDALEQSRLAGSRGCSAVLVADGAEGDLAISGFLSRDALEVLQGVDVVALWSDARDIRDARRALARRTGPLVPLVATRDLASYSLLERHLCVDTTAAGGNATLLAQVGARS